MKTLVVPYLCHGSGFLGWEGGQDRGHKRKIPHSLGGNDPDLFIMPCVPFPQLGFDSAEAWVKKCNLNYGYIV